MISSHSSRYYSYLNSAAEIINQYDGEQPFHIFSKKYFSQYKKYGSTDRKQITQVCYVYFRLGKSYPDVPVKQKILLGLLYTHQPMPEAWSGMLESKNLSPLGKPENIFPWKDTLSNGIDSAAFEQSFLRQPDVFLRVRPGFENAVIAKLKHRHIDFSMEGNAIRLTNNTNTADFLSINKEVVIQDLSSQKTGALMQYIKDQNPGKKLKIYDCCAASGGKSILAADVFKDFSLTVTDIRPSIIANLKKRFMEAGVKNYTASAADVSQKPNLACKDFDVVIADVPCTGSGTWARTPEQLLYFNETKIREYAMLQRKIINHLPGYIKQGGYLLYITCSVFKDENEAHVQHLQQAGLILIRQEVIAGYHVKADTMFAALLQKTAS